MSTKSNHTASSASLSHGLFYLEDLKVAQELIPPAKGEILRQWMLRCMHQGVIKKEEAMKIKDDNPKAWNSAYLIEQNAEVKL